MAGNDDWLIHGRIAECADVILELRCGYACRSFSFACETLPKLAIFHRNSSIPLIQLIRIDLKDGDRL